MNKKYEFTDEKRIFLGHTLYLIRACRDIGHHKAGWIGGWIESEANLSQDGECWIVPGCIVMGDAQVTGDAVIGADSIVSECAKVSGKAIVFGSTVTDHAGIYDEAYIHNSHVGGTSLIDGKANVRTSIIECSNMHGETWIDSSQVIGSILGENTRLIGSRITHCTMSGGQYYKTSMNRFSAPENACYSDNDTLDAHLSLIVCDIIKGDYGSLTYCPEKKVWYLDHERYLSRWLKNMIKKRFPDKIEAFNAWAEKMNIKVVI